jgi:hypothetical protein
MGGRHAGSHRSHRRASNPASTRNCRTVFKLSNLDEIHAADTFLEFMFPSVLAVALQMSTERLRSLVASTARRSAALFDIPTSAVSGVPSFEAVPWNGVTPPAGTQSAIIATLL